jgi:RNA polymerase sigma factor (sigma-70 family)
MPTVTVEAAARDLVVSVVSQHADSLLRTARRYTACAADAEDAYQRALEIFVKNAGRLDAEGAHRWLHVVVRNEALAVRRGRSKLVGVEDEAALDALDDARHVASVEERSERLDELGRAAEALQRLKPQEVTALWLKAEGLSYEEIAERQGWTYTKVNRCVTEGRRAFLRRYAGIEAGEECERWAPLLSAVADGEATPRQLLEARPHLRNCPACRASLAAMRRGGRAVAGLLPPVVLPVGAAEAAGGRLAEAWVSVGGSLHDRTAGATAALHDRAAGATAALHDRAAGVAASLHDRAAGVAASLHDRAAATSAWLHATGGGPSGRAAAVAASVVALAGGGVVAERGFGGGDARAATGPAPAGVARATSAPPPAADPPQPAGRDFAASKAVASAAASGSGADRAAREGARTRPTPPADAAFAPKAAGVAEGARGSDSTLSRSPAASGPSRSAPANASSPGDATTRRGGDAPRETAADAGGEFGLVTAPEDAPRATSPRGREGRVGP